MLKKTSLLMNFIMLINYCNLCPVELMGCPTKMKIWDDTCTVNKKQEKLLTALQYRTSIQQLTNENWACNDFIHRPKWYYCERKLQMFLCFLKVLNRWQVVSGHVLVLFWLSLWFVSCFGQPDDGIL